VIVFDAAKAVLLLNPKTGTRSAVGYFGRIQFHGHVRTVHAGHLSYKEVGPTLGEGEYKFFSFYRCPVERFVSVCNFIISEWNSIWGNYPISPETMAKVQAEIRELTLEDLLGMLVRVEHGPVLDLARPQTKWLVPEVNLLDFRDFDAELVRLATSFGLDAPAQVPHYNESPPKFDVNDLSPEFIDRIKQHYARDYDFFASRGITFNR
jgi:hypothetical protein